MVQKETLLKVIDNSGASVVKCIHIFQKSPRLTARIGTCLVVSVKRLRKAIPKKLVSKSKICFALLVGISYPFNKSNGVTIKAVFNTVILLTKYNKKGVSKNKPGDLPIANRFSGSVYYEVRKMGYAKVVSLAKGVL
jgi:large subunit ribosomal protein L14